MRTQAAIFLVILVAAAACGVKRKRPPAQAETSAPTTTLSDADAAFSPFGNLGMFGSMLSGKLDEPGPYDERRESADFDDDAPHFGVLELSGPIVEMQSFSLFASAGGIELRELTDKLDALANNEIVRGLIVRAGDLSLSMAAAEELRAALRRFKGDGARTLACHAERLSNVSYYVFSACDSIAISPVGEVVISGVTAGPVHIKQMLAKLGMQADFVHIGAYKGAAEPITRDQPSAEMRETIQAIIDRYYETMVAGIAQGRKLDAEVVRTLIDTALFSPEQAVAAKLADQVSMYGAYRDSIVGDVGWHKVKIGGAGGPPDIGKLMEFVGIKPRSRPDEPHVALVYALGNIIDGQGQGILGAREEIASRTLTAAIDALAADDDVAAIVLRIDSGGGSALASETILNALDAAKAKKPVIVSMGGVAASGGYYIACHATKVFASDTTLTGSIGVVGGKLVLTETMDKLGIKVFPMARGKRALMGSMLDFWSDEERALVAAQMEEIYKTFVTHVANGRGKDYEAVHAVAQGRVWTGHAAKEHGLIDEVGGLAAALAAARELAGVDPDVDLEVYPPEPTLMDIMGSFGQVQAPLGLGRAFGLDTRVQAWLDDIAVTVGAPEARVIAQTLRTLVQLRESRVLAATVFPVVMY